MRRTSGKLFLALLLLAKSASCANILALMVVLSHSHHIWNIKYLEALANRGHHITYFGIDVYKNPPKNITHIFAENMYDALRDLDLTQLTDDGPYTATVFLAEWENAEAHMLIKSEAMEKLKSIIKTQKFDLVVHDMGSCPFLVGIVDIMGRPPLMGITAYGVPQHTLEILGNPMAYSSKPYFYTTNSNIMSPIQRAHNYFLHLFAFAVRWFLLRTQDEYSKQCFGKDVRSLEHILDDINIILVNYNPGVDYPFPKVPGLVPIGGLHIRPTETLPQNLKSFLDEAKHGVIFFSLGSNIQMSMLDKKKKELFMEAFKKLAPVKVLWKYESDYSEKPENVEFVKWAPQQAILAHPNVRLFFTHSGLLSTQEAIYHGKPIVGMPFFLDQHVNVGKCVQRGLGEQLDFKTVTVEKVVETITRVLQTPRYSENAKKASVIFRDEMEHPLDRAIFWTEYAIRHKGAPHLRHSARNLYWFQNWMLDVIIGTGIVLFLFVFTVYKFITIFLCGNSENEKVKKS